MPSETTEDRLRRQYGELLLTAELAELLRYSSSSALRRAHAKGRLPVQLHRFAGRRTLFAKVEEVARVLDELAP